MSLNLDGSASCKTHPSDDPSRPDLAPHRQAERCTSQKRNYISDAFRNISGKQRGVVATRIRVREDRKSLRRQRETVIGLDVQVANGLRELFNKWPSEELSDLLAQFEQLQESRDKLLQQEDDYNIAEDKLIGDEFDLQEAESRLFPELPSGGSSFIDDKDLTTYLEGLETLESSGGESPMVHRPEMTQYFSRSGDADIIKESLDELRRERVHIVEEERVRARVGRMLDKESQDFLNEFDRRQSELQDQLAHVQEDLAKLQEKLAWDNDVVYKSNQFGNNGGPLDQKMDELEPLEVSDPDLRFPVVSLSLSTFPPLSSSSQKTFAAASARSTDSLLLPDEDSSPVFPSPAESLTPETIGPTEYINNWLLDMLRRSPREVQRLKSTKTIQRLQLKEVQLAESVLGKWIDDGEDVNEFSRQEFGARSLYVYSNAVAASARISKSRSLPTLTTKAYRFDSLQGPNNPIRRDVRITSTIRPHDRRSEPDLWMKLRFLNESQPRPVSASVHRGGREGPHTQL